MVVGFTSNTIICLDLKAEADVKVLFKLFKHFYIDQVTSHLVLSLFSLVCLTFKIQKRKYRGKLSLII